MKKYLGRRNSNGTISWVSQFWAKKGTKRALHDGTDWGYTTHSPGWAELDAPIPFTQYWERRFRADARKCNFEVVEY